MPSHNCFRHQDYGLSPENCDFCAIEATSRPSAGTDNFQARMRTVGRSLHEAGVRVIYLLHGTFVGADGLGLIREVARVAPELGQSLRQLRKSTVDWLADDSGNYTQDYARSFESAISQGDIRIPVRLLNWSSENHHIGRADGAIRLLDELAHQEWSGGSRALLWGHSHGGNVLALMSNLLGNDADDNSRFFRAARSYYRWPLWQKVDLPMWTRVEKQLIEKVRPWDPVKLDMVTFGTPVRYGWDSDGYAKLLHFIHHKQTSSIPPLVCRFPPTSDDILSGAGGDLIQQLGIAGTNFAPAIWSWRAWMADIRLHRLLQEGLRRADFLRHLRFARRLHDEGVNLLVDYGPLDGHVGQHFAGHAVYTRRSWLLFHAEEIVRRLYL